MAETKAREFAEAEGATYISPYNNPDVIAGAGTVGLDLVEAMPSFDVRGDSAWAAAGWPAASAWR